MNKSVVAVTSSLACSSTQSVGRSHAVGRQETNQQKRSGNRDGVWSFSFGARREGLTRRHTPRLFGKLRECSTHKARRKPQVRPGQKRVCPARPQTGIRSDKAGWDIFQVHEHTLNAHDRPSRVGSQPRRGVARPRLACPLLLRTQQGVAIDSAWYCLRTPHSLCIAVQELPSRLRSDQQTPVSRVSK